MEAIVIRKNEELNLERGCIVQVIEYILYKKWCQINYHCMKFSCYVFKDTKEFVNVKLREELC